MNQNDRYRIVSAWGKLQTILNDAETQPQGKFSMAIKNSRRNSMNNTFNQQQMQLFYSDSKNDKKTINNYRDRYAQPSNDYDYYQTQGQNFDFQKSNQNQSILNDTIQFHNVNYCTAQPTMQKFRNTSINISSRSFRQRKRIQSLLNCETQQIKSILKMRAHSRDTNKNMTSYISNQTCNNIKPNTQYNNFQNTNAINVNNQENYKFNILNQSLNPDDLEILKSMPEDQRETIIQKTEIIHSLPVDLILDLFQAKCRDQGVEYFPHQASQFIEKINRNSKQRILQLIGSGLGPSSGQCLAAILEQNEHFSRVLLEQNNLGDEGITFLGQCLQYNSTIIHLDISNNNISSQGAANLFQLLLDNNSLISIDISNKLGLLRNKIGINSARSLQKWVSSPNCLLQFLNLSGTNIGIIGFQALLLGLKSNKTLVHLDISNNDLGPDSVPLMITHLYNTCLTELVLSSNNLGDKGLLEFCGMMGHQCKNYRFEMLNFSNNELTHKSIGKFFDTLHKNSFLQKLILDDNNFRGKSIYSLIQYITENSSIMYLSLNRCQIEDHEGKPFGESVKGAKSLKYLFISQNAITQNGGIALAEALYENQSISVLDISANPLGDLAGVSIAVMLLKNNNLRDLNLKETNLHNQSCEKIVQAMKFNKTLLKINLERNQIHYNYIDQIQLHLNKNLNRHKKHQIEEEEHENDKLKNQDYQNVDLIECFHQNNHQQQQLLSQINNLQQHYEQQVITDQEQLALIEIQHKEVVQESLLLTSKIQKIEDEEKKLIQEFVLEKERLERQKSIVMKDQKEIHEQIKEASEKQLKLKNKIEKVIKDRKQAQHEVQLGYSKSSSQQMYVANKVELIKQNVQKLSEEIKFIQQEDEIKLNNRSDNNQVENQKSKELKTTKNKKKKQ